MKVFLLAAGKGTRLRPYTESIPKCLIPVHGKPLLEIWLDLLIRHGIDDVLINTHHHADQVKAFAGIYKHRNEINIVISYEPRLLGSAGTIWHCRDFVDREDDFMIFYADNLTNMNIEKFAEFHNHTKKKNGILSMGLFHAENPSACGIARLDSELKIISFIEKPVCPESHLANAGIYMATSEIFDYLAMLSPNLNNGILDLGHDLLPILSGKMYGYLISEYLRDIGTIESYHMGVKEWENEN